MVAHKYKKIVLVVLDGFGVASYSHGNAVAIANPAALNDMVSRYPALTLLASGPVVGLPWGEMGNSEVGHLNMGAGRIVGQDLPRINQAISDGSFFKNNVFLETVEHVKKYNSSLHLLGMVGHGGIHSSDEHLFALLALSAEQNLKKVYIHLITDGRDSNQRDALNSIRKLAGVIAQVGVGQIATITGRFFAMDRGAHWNQTDLTYKAMVNGLGEAAESPEDAILANYNKNIFDEMIPPTVLVNRKASEIEPLATVSKNDAVIFFNFRSDRAVQLTKAFVDNETLPEANRHPKIENLRFVTMTEYFSELPVGVAFPIINLKNNLPEVLAEHKFRQYHTAETEKFAHVTSFFNGGKNQPYVGEDREIIQSPSNDKNYADQPEMSGIELTENLIAKIKSEDYQFYLANFANADMVGHTGNLEAGIKAVNFLDRYLEQIRKAVFEVNGLLIITADHGNIEEMLNSTTGEINKEHTTNPVPFLIVAKDLAFKVIKDRDLLSLSSLVPSGVIADIAPTILEFFDIKKPVEMNGVSLYSQIEKLLKS